ncbi:uncharacterized protein [Atheta coriaria]|uniref:uncharacterized protein n=1 Tax=Dalotia coriaria TaxID=877792 RepID=UPI0031F33D75
MILQILLASILTLNFCDGITVSPPAEDSHTEATNIETTKVAYDYSPGSTIPSDQAQNLQQPSSNENARHLDSSWSYQPFIEYANVSPHSKSITQIAIGKDAVEALQKSKLPQHQTNQNILYLQSEVAKPVDNQLPVQPEPNGNLVYYLPPEGAPIQDAYATQPAQTVGPGPLLYYSQVPQQLHPVPPNENVVYITPQPQPQPHNDYGPPPPQNYYLVTHIQPTAPQPQPEVEEKPEKPKNVVVENMKEEKKDEEKKKEDKDEHEHVLVESNTAKAIIEEYERHYVKRRKNVDVKVDGESGTSDTSTTPSPYPSATTPLTITKPAPLSRQPIIVADLDENNLEYDDKNNYSTTQSTIKTVKTSSSLYHATQPLIVTPRPLGTTFLAPITAGVQLQSVDNQHNHNGKHDAVVVEVQKSVPYYLGKFEFVQNDKKPTKSDEIKQNVDLGANLLKYSIERLPNPQAFITEYNNSGLGPSINQDQDQDQEQESGQFDYKVQNAPPYQQVLVPVGPVTKLEKVEPELPQPVQVRQVFLPQPVKTVADYIQKPFGLHHQHQHHYNQPSVLLEPFPQVTKLIPQFVPLKHHQEVQKVPMKSYSYAPSYQPSHYHHHQHHNYQISHSGHKKPKSFPPNYQHLGNHPQFYHTVKFNDYIGMKPPKISVASVTNPPPAAHGPPFKASQHLQTIHEYLPSTQLTDQQVRKYRNPRHSFGSSIRLEYGFMPPLIPSIEIDEFGKPIEKSDS